MLQVLIWASAPLVAVLAVSAVAGLEWREGRVKRAIRKVELAIDAADLAFIDLVSWVSGMRLERRWQRTIVLSAALAGAAGAGAFADLPWAWGALAAGALIAFSVFRRWSRDEAERAEMAMGDELRFSRGGHLTREALIATFSIIVFAAVAFERAQIVTPSAVAAWWPPPDTVIAVFREIYAALPIVGLWPDDLQRTAADGPSQGAIFVFRAFLQMLLLVALFRYLTIWRQVSRGGDYARPFEEALIDGDYEEAQRILQKARRDAVDMSYPNAIALVKNAAFKPELFESKIVSLQKMLGWQRYAIVSASLLARQNGDLQLIEQTKAAFNTLIKHPEFRRQGPLFVQTLEEFAEFLFLTRRRLANEASQLAQAGEECSVLKMALEEMKKGEMSDERITRASARLALGLAFRLKRQKGKTPSTELSELRRFLEARAGQTREHMELVQRAIDQAKAAGA